LAQREVEETTPLERVQHDHPFGAVQVRMPDLTRFDQLLSQGERAYV